jgi:hypothetical protein
MKSSSESIDPVAFGGAWLLRAILLLCLVGLLDESVTSAALLFLAEEIVSTGGVKGRGRQSTPVLEHKMATGICDPPK